MPVAEVKACSASPVGLSQPQPLIERVTTRRDKPTTCAPFPWSAYNGGDVLTDATHTSGPTRLTSRPQRSLKYFGLAGGETQCELAKSQRDSVPTAFLDLLGHH